MNRQSTSPSTNLLDAALAYAARGLYVLPVNRDKHPCLRHGVYEATTDPDQIRRWTQWRWASGVAVATGLWSGVVVLDLDAGGQETLAALERELGPLPDGPITATTSGGEHRWFAYPEDGPPVRSRPRIAPGIDVRGDVGYVLVPPSRARAKDGTIGAYTWRVSLDDAPLPELPPAWLDLVRGKRFVAPVPESVEAAPLPAAAHSANGHHPHRLTVVEGIDLAEALAGAPHGQRNDLLFRLACKLRALDVSLEEAVAVVTVAAANCSPPWGELPDDRETVEQLVERVYRTYPAGTASRRSATMALRPGGRALQAPVSVESQPRLLTLAMVEPEPVRWLWRGRIPLGKLTVLDGDPGVGKSLLTLDLAARVSTGREMPDGTRGLDGPAGVVLLSAEDDPGDTIRPRLDVAGGDPTRVAVLTTVTVTRTGEDGARQEQERGITLYDTAALREAIEATGARLVVVDPVMAFVGKTDTHVDAEVRQLLRPLAELAQETGVAVVAVRHLNKSAATSPLYRGGGSIGIIGAARSGLLAARDPDDDTGRRVVLAVTKSNLAEPAPALAYTIEAVSHPVAGWVPRIAWQGASPHTARSLLAAPTDEAEEERSAVTEAVRFLRDLLASGPLPASEARRAASQAGIAFRTLRRAKDLLRVRTVRVGFGSTGGWLWELPPDAATDHAPSVDTRTSTDTGATVPGTVRHAPLALWPEQPAGAPTDAPASETETETDEPVDRARVLTLAGQSGFPCFWSQVNRCWYAGAEGWRVLTEAASDAAVREALTWLVERSDPARDDG